MKIDTKNELFIGEDVVRVKKKVALVASFVGSNYFGLQDTTVSIHSVRISYF